MEWTKDAENAVKKVPFFVRKKVRSRVETQVAETGKKVVTLTDVRTAQKRHLQNMSKEIAAMLSRILLNRQEEYC